MQRVLTLSSVNHHLMCVLCGGYLLDATTISECLHSFCRSCIVRYLETSYNCPVCDTEIHKTKPLSNIRSDPTLQEIVLKLVPTLYDKEEERRRHFMKAQTANESDQPGPSRVGAPSASNQLPSNKVFVTLKYFHGASRYQKEDKILSLFPTRYLCCPRNMPVHVLKKFIRMKFDLPSDWQIEVWKTDEALLGELKLTDVIRVFGAFRERTPLELQFSVTSPTSSLSLVNGSKMIDAAKAKHIPLPTVAFVHNSPADVEMTSLQDSPRTTTSEVFTTETDFVVAPAEETTTPLESVDDVKSQGEDTSNHNKSDDDTLSPKPVSNPMMPSATAQRPSAELNIQCDLTKQATIVPTAENHPTTTDDTMESTTTILENGDRPIFDEHRPLFDVANIDNAARALHCSEVDHDIDAVVAQSLTPLVAPVSTNAD